MAFITGFGKYLPERIVTNKELAHRLSCEAAWIERMSGIQERRYAADGETVCEMAARAAVDCIERSAVDRAQIGLVIVATSTAECRFPGPGAAIVERLGLGATPAIDLCVASAGSLFSLVLADSCAATFGTVLVIAAEKMSSVVAANTDKKTAFPFGDGAGACIVTRNTAALRMIGSRLYSNGRLATDLCLQHDNTLQMNGPSVIAQAARKVPKVITEVLEQHSYGTGDVAAVVVHQANLNLIVRIADALQLPRQRLFSNIARYGNTSSASMLIAAAEWFECASKSPAPIVVFAAFGAGFYWGAVLARFV